MEFFFKCYKRIHRITQELSFQRWKLSKKKNEFVKENGIDHIIYYIDFTSLIEELSLGLVSYWN